MTVGLKYRYSLLYSAFVLATASILCVIERQVVQRIMDKISLFSHVIEQMIKTIAE